MLMITGDNYTKSLHPFLDLAYVKYASPPNHDVNMSEIDATIPTHEYEPSSQVEA